MSTKKVQIVKKAKVDMGGGITVPVNPSPNPQYLPTAEADRLLSEKKAKETKANTADEQKKLDAEAAIEKAKQADGKAKGGNKKTGKAK